MPYEDRRQYRRRIAKNMRRWTDATLKKEHELSRETGYGWEATEWRAALDEELKRRQVQ